MFAIPGILGLLFFIYLRPQEAIESLQAVPFLNLFFMLALFGAAVDMRLRISKVVQTPILPWAIMFYIWNLISLGLSAPAKIMGVGIIFTITFIIFVVLSQAVQTFKTFEKVALMVAALGFLLALISVDQGTTPFECMRLAGGEHSIDVMGVPDGRPCTANKNDRCYDNDPAPGAEYICERPGVLGTHSIAARVRYRGVLQDPNEMSVALSSGFALLIAIWLRGRTRTLKVAVGLSFFFTGWATMLTGSRSGQLGFVMTLGAFVLWRYRWKAVATLGPLMLPALLAIAAGGGGRDDAKESTEERYEAWRAGFDMFRRSPIWGVGQQQYSVHHYLTAHNTYMLVLAEGGIVGIYIFSMMIWLTMKVPLKAIMRFQTHPEARVAELWAVALLGCMGAILAGSAFLSFAYHSVLWVFFGLSGAYFVCVKRHDPDFEVKIGFWDYLGVAVVDVFLYFALNFFLVSKGH